MAHSFWGGNNTEENVVQPTKANTLQALERGNSLMASGQTSMEDHGSVGSTSSMPMATSIAACTRPIIAKPPVTQLDFVDALTAVMTGKVDFSDDGGDDDDDVFSISTVSTICSRVEVSSPPEDSPTRGDQLTQSVGVGPLFFYLDQKTSMRHMVAPLENELDSSKKELALVPASQATDDANEMHFGRSVASIRSMIEAKAKEADRDGLFEKGCEMYKEGERLLSEGKVDEARDALQKAHSFQKESILLVTTRMAEAMHKQGLDHCDRGDKQLAVILLGVAEIIKHRPSAANIRMGAQAHRGYRRVCPKEEKYIAGRREVDGYLKVIEEEAAPMAKTLHTYSKSLTMT